MPNLNENKRYWGQEYRWREGGDVWSRPWGDVSFQWYCTLLPRVHRRLPARRILEIGCGYGRWTHYLKDLCEELIVVDVSDRCIAACQTRFERASNISYHLTDGLSLEMVADRAIDMVFSFDSLVHADVSVMESYVTQLARILSDDGMAFLHHSNLGEHIDAFRAGQLEEYLHWRDPDVSAEWVRWACARSGLRCITQEIVYWRDSSVMIDCFSSIVRIEAFSDVPDQVVKNSSFMDEARNAAELSRLYSFST